MLVRVHRLSIICNMKTQSTLNTLIQNITRTLGSVDAQAALLREPNILRSFTPDDMVRPFKDLPNVSNLFVRTNMLDPLLSKYDLASKLSPELSFEEYSWRIKAANRYLRIMYYRMERLLCSGEHGKYWILALMLMLKSKVIRAVALRKLNRNWHRDFKFGTIKVLLKRLDNMLLNMEERISIKRTYAVKAVDSEGKVTKWRPIGNPGYADRMYLYIWQSFFVIYVNSFISKSQHAYRPGQGVATALKDLKTLIEDESFTEIHEFDLKGAFPSVSIPETCDALKASGFPIQLGDFLLNLSSKTIEMIDRSRQKLPEEKFDRQENIHRGILGGYDELNPAIKMAKYASTIGTYWTSEEPWAKNPAVNKKVDTFWSTDPEAIAAEEEDEELKELLNKTRNRWGFESSVRKFTDMTGILQPAAILVPNKVEVPTHLRGFPQGSAWSPVLFNFAFEYAALRGHFYNRAPDSRLVSYADDFIAAFKRKVTGILQESEIMNRFGLRFNHEKSQVLKTGGRWVVDKFKFLGVTFHVSNEKAIIVEGTPRSGKILEFDKFTMVEEFKSRDVQLRKIAKTLLPDSPPSPQELLDSWGRGEFPGNIVPDSVVKGESRVNKRLLRRLQEVAKSVPSGRVESSDLGVSEKLLFAKLKDGSNLNWLGIRRAGLILNRLHGGNWTPLEEPASRSIAAKPSTKGRSLIDLERSRFNLLPPSLRDRMMSIWNSTSMATKISLGLLRDPKSIKLRRKGIEHK